MHICHRGTSFSDLTYPFFSRQVLYRYLSFHNKKEICKIYIMFHQRDFFYSQRKFIPEHGYLGYLIVVFLFSFFVVIINSIKLSHSSMEAPEPIPPCMHPYHSCQSKLISPQSLLAGLNNSNSFCSKFEDKNPNK